MNQSESGEVKEHHSERALMGYCTIDSHSAEVVVSLRCLPSHAAGFRQALPCDPQGCQRHGAQLLQDLQPAQQEGCAQPRYDWSPALSSLLESAPELLSSCVCAGEFIVYLNLSDLSWKDLALAIVIECFDRVSARFSLCLAIPMWTYWFAHVCHCTYRTSSGCWRRPLSW